MFVKWKWFTNLLLYQLQFLGLQQLLRHSLWTRLGAQKKLPELFAEGRGIFVEEPGELNLECFDIRL